MALTTNTSGTQPCNHRNCLTCPMISDKPVHKINSRNWVCHVIIEFAMYYSEFYWFLKKILLKEVVLVHNSWINLGDGGNIKVSVSSLCYTYSMLPLWHLFPQAHINYTYVTLCQLSHKLCTSSYTWQILHRYLVEVEQFTNSKREWGNTGETFIELWKNLLWKIFIEVVCLCLTYLMMLCVVWFVCF